MFNKLFRIIGIYYFCLFVHDLFVALNRNVGPILDKMIEDIQSA